MKIRHYSLFISTDKASGAPAIIPASDFQDPADYNRALASLEVRGLR